VQLGLKGGERGKRGAELSRGERFSGNNNNNNNTQAILQQYSTVATLDVGVGSHYITFLNICMYAIYLSNISM
jgi:hypothetical protein